MPVDPQFPKPSEEQNKTGDIEENTQEALMWQRFSGIPSSDWQVRVSEQEPQPNDTHTNHYDAASRSLMEQGSHCALRILRVLPLVPNNTLPVILSEVEGPHVLVNQQRRPR